MTKKIDTELIGTRVSHDVPEVKAPKMTTRKRTIDYILSGHQPTISEIDSYCQSELLDKKNHRKPIAGFSSKG